MILKNIFTILFILLGVLFGKVVCETEKADDYAEIIKENKEAKLNIKLQESQYTPAPFVA